MGLAALALVTAACAGQSVPPRQPFEVPEAIVPDVILPTDPDSLFPTSGECTLAHGGGVRILEVIEGSGADGLLNAGDIVTAVDATLVASSEQLGQVVEAHAVGDVVEIAATRAGEPFTVRVQLGAGPQDSRKAAVGIIEETKLILSGPTAQVSSVNAVGRFSRPVVLEGQVYLHEPLSGSWLHYPNIPAITMAALDSQLYSVAPQEEGLGIVRLGDGTVIPIEAGMFNEAVGEELFTLSPTRFDGVFGSVGGVLLVGGVAGSDAGQARAVFGVDPISGRVTWGELIPLSLAGNPLVAFGGFRSPNGERAAIQLAEQDLITGAFSPVSLYLIVREGGSASILPGSDHLPGAGDVTGWIDDDTLLFLTADVPRVIYGWSLDTGEQTAIVSIAEENAADLVSVTPVGDGRHLLQIGLADVQLIDMDHRLLTRPIARGCRYAAAGGLAG